MSVSPAPSAEDYKRQLRDLKSKLRQSNETNRHLIERLTGVGRPSNFDEKADSLTSAMKVTRGVVRIQKVFRGFLVRRNGGANPGTKREVGGGSAQEFFRVCAAKLERTGLTLEAAFRVADVDLKGKVFTSELVGTLKKLGAVGRSGEARLRFLLDEEAKGEVGYEDFLATVDSFGAAGEGRTEKVAARWRGETLRRFAAATTTLDFHGSTMNSADFAALIGWTATSAGLVLTEREKNCVARALAPTAAVDEAAVNNRLKQLRSRGEEPRTSAGANGSTPDFAIRQVRKAAPKDSAFRDLAEFLGQVDLPPTEFLSRLAEFVGQKRGILIQGCIPFSKMREFLSGLKPQASESMIDSLGRALLKPGLADQTRGGGHAEEAGVDLLEFKNRLSRAAGPANCVPLLSLLGAAKVEQSGLDTMEFFKKVGFDPRRKVDFSEFYVLGQKICGFNFAESSELFEKLDVEKRWRIPLANFAEELDKFQQGGKQGGAKGGNKSDGTAKDPFGSVKTRIESQTRTFSLDFVSFLGGCFSDFSDRASPSLLRRATDASTRVQLSDADFSVLLERMGAARASEVSAEEILRFLAAEFPPEGFEGVKGSSGGEAELFYRFASRVLERVSPGLGVEEALASRGLDDEWTPSLPENKAQLKLGEAFDISPRLAKTIFTALGNSPGSAALASAIAKHRPSRKQPFKLQPTGNRGKENEPRNISTNRDTASLAPSSGGPSSATNRRVAPSASSGVFPAGPTSLAGIGGSAASSAAQLPSKASMLAPPTVVVGRTSAGADSDLEEKFLRFSTYAEPLLESHYHEVTALLKDFLSHERGISILEARRVVRGILPGPEGQGLVEHLKEFDVNGNGAVERTEWAAFVSAFAKFTQKLTSSGRGIAAASGRVEGERAVMPVTNEEEFMIFLASPSAKGLTFPSEAIEELRASGRSSVFMVEAKRALERRLSRPDFLQLTSLLRFLDFDCNGNVSVSDIEFLHHTLDATGASLPPALLRDSGLDESAIKTMAFRGFAASLPIAPAAFSVFQLATKLAATTAISKHDLGAMLKKAAVDGRQNFVGYDELLDLLGFSTQMEIARKRLDENLKDVKFPVEIGKLRKTWATRRRKEVLTFKDFLLAERRMAEYLAFEALDPENQDALEAFLLFGDLSLYSAPSQGASIAASRAVLGTTGVSRSGFGIAASRGGSAVGASFASSASIDARGPEEKLLDLVADKFLKKNLTNFETLQKMSDRRLPLLGFQSILQANDTGVSLEETLRVFRALGGVEAHEIRFGAFLDAIMSRYEARLTAAAEAAAAASLPLAETAQIGAEEESLDALLSEIEPTPTNFVEGRRTVVDSPLVALKVAMGFVKEIQPGRMFEDPEFGPRDPEDMAPLSLYYEGVPVMGSPSVERVRWRRLKAINAAGEFDKDGMKASDVKQGELGDCWFVGALSVLATQDDLVYNEVGLSMLKAEVSDEVATRLLRGVHPSLFHFLRRYGLYIFKFFKNCKWVYVITDDYIPTDDNNPESNGIFAVCESSEEFWVQMIEKAYAKLNGCYGSLIGGAINEGIKEMTGYPMESLNPTDNPQLWQTPSKLFSELDRLRRKKCLMGCSIRTKNVAVEGDVLDAAKKKTGLIASHAYGLLDTLKLSDGTQLVLLRNPWGKSEWNGKFSDASHEFKQNAVEINKILASQQGSEFEEIKPDSDDGVFVMTVEDFSQYYNNVFIAKNFEDQFSGIRFFYPYDESLCPNFPLGTQLTLDQLKSFPANPQFLIKLKRKTSLFFYIEQQSERMRSKGEKYYLVHMQNVSKQKMNSNGPFETDFAVLLLKLNPNEETVDNPFSKENLISKPMLKKSHNYNFELEAGNYMVFICLQGGARVGELYLNLYFNCDKKEIYAHQVGKVENKGEPIIEEEEDVQQFSESFKKAIHKVLLQSIEQ